MHTPDSLASAIGRVALADATADEWLMHLFYALLWPQHPEAVRILVSNDTASNKVVKVARLVEHLGLADDKVPGWDKPIKDVLKRFQKLKDDRDNAVHSFYADSIDAAGAIRRFRSRSKEVSSVTVDELSKLNDRISDYNAFLEALTIVIEDRRAHEQAREVDLLDMLEDCRELLIVTPLRMSDEKLAALRTTEKIRIALGGTGRWRSLDDDEPPTKGESLAIIDPTIGRITVTTPDGETFSGGDTGWRNVTELAQTEEPEVDWAFLRRIHGNVRLIQSGGRQLHQVADAAAASRSLSDRTFSDGELRTGIPQWLQDLEGFGPGTPG